MGGTDQAWRGQSLSCKMIIVTLKMTVGYGICELM